VLKGKQTSHGIFTWSLENENTHNGVQQQGDPRIMLSVCVCREPRGLQTSALFPGSEKQFLFSCNSLLLKRQERRPTHMKAQHSFSPRLAVQIVGVSPLGENFYFALAGGVRPPLLLRFLLPARNPPLRPPNLSVPSRHYFSLLLLFSFFPFFFPLSRLLTNQLKTFFKTTF